MTNTLGNLPFYFGRTHRCLQLVWRQVLGETLQPTELVMAYQIQEQGQELDHPHHRHHRSVAKMEIEI